MYVRGSRPVVSVASGSGRDGHPTRFRRASSWNDDNARVIVVDSLVRRFGDRTVIDGLSLTVASGERVVLRGANGVGKTTLLRCILGTLAPDAGSIEVAGHLAGSIEARASIGASLSQERSFYLRLSGRENLLLFARLRGRTRREAQLLVKGVVEELELGAIAAQRADRCSTGQLQQLGLARALLGDPPVLLLDEPTRSLDEAARGRFWAALERRPQAAVIVATHLPEDVGHVAWVLDLAPGGAAT